MRRVRKLIVLLEGHVNRFRNFDFLAVTVELGVELDMHDWEFAATHLIELHWESTANLVLLRVVPILGLSKGG